LFVDSLILNRYIRNDYCVAYHLQSFIVRVVYKRNKCIKCSVQNSKASAVLDLNQSLFDIV